jgi:hypothetical protein
MTQSPIQRPTSAVCNHCGARYPQQPTIPVAEDDDAWAEIAQHHKPSCVWAGTRAGRLPDSQAQASSAKK